MMDLKAGRSLCPSNFTELHGIALGCQTLDFLCERIKPCVFKPLLIWVSCHSQLYLILTDTVFNQVLSLWRESIAWAKGRESPLEGIVDDFLATMSKQPRVHEPSPGLWESLCP